MLIIGIAGGTGSGKTTVVEQIIAELPKDEVCIISQDSYYTDTSHLIYDERVKINFDHPNSIDFDLMLSHLRELRNGKSFEQPIYSFIDHNRTNETITTFPKKVVIVEGILILSHPEIREMFDINVYVHADSDERLIRRLKRDILDRGRDLNEVLDRYQNTLKPMHKQFIEPTKEFADIIIPTNKLNKVAVKLIQNIIHHQLA
jgi:uridine kinase|tara:strand:- start:1703 stop:2311 length:609 start_codon:yes stop_codon:yes gene_type:complete